MTIEFKHYRLTVAGLVAGVSLAALGQLLLVSGAQAADLEKCYGISKAYENDGLASGPDADIPGASETDFDGNAWKFVDVDTCVEIETPHGPGSLDPVPGRPPKN